MSAWDYPTITEIARDTGENPLVDVVVGPKAGTIFGAMPMKEIEGLAESVSQITSYPGVTWRRFGEGLLGTKGGERDIYFHAALLSTLSEADALKAEKSKLGLKGYRAKELKKHLKAMGKEASYGLFYNQVSSKSVNGIFRLVDSSYATYVDCGSGSETYSIYGLRFGDDAFYGFYSTFADGKMFSVHPYDRRLKNIDPGSTDKELAVYQTEVNLMIGVAYAHPNCVGRITNMDGSNPLTLAKVYELYDAMDGKPDLFVMNYNGLKEFAQWKEAFVKMSPGETGLNFDVQSFDGVPLLVDTNLISTESGL
ncbi:MAG: hypothetical protein U9Q07_14770 [Planctomycetota bacterium]|nr:hypothetical protein [Planctomycetota bacterium]